ncbi:hypothetical protein TNCV_4043491 [Trichonephila clavipes]|nr:hypothetical protein TNCV_4043491 [Trichonephila clavipes]
MNYYNANNEDNINVKNNKGLDQVPDSPEADLKRLFNPAMVVEDTVPKQTLPDGRGYELVSSVRALVPQKFSVEEELMHVKHVDVKSPHVGVMWKFGIGVISSGIVLIT